MDRRLILNRTALTLLASVLVAVAPARGDQILGPGRIDDSGKVLLPGGPTLGTFTGGAYISKPDALSVGQTNGFALPYLRPFAGARVRSVLDKLNDLPTNARDFTGFDPTGAADSTAAIQAAINSLPVSGGVVEVPCGSRIKISATLQVHNGSASAYTTKNGARIEGACAAPSSWSFSGALPDASIPVQSVQFVWAGPADQPMMQINGGDGWGVSNVVFDCNNLASEGLKYISASTGESQRIAGLNCKKFAVSGTTVPGITIGGQTYKADSLRNHFTQVYARMADGGRCIGMDGSRTATGAATTDTDFNLFENVQCQDKSIAGSTPGAVYFGVSDSNIVRNLQCTLANSTSSCIEYDATSQHGPNLPGSNLVDFVDWGGIVKIPVKITEKNGSPLQAYNFITNVLHVNGGDTRIRLHPKIFMSDGSLSVTDEKIQAKGLWLKTDSTLAVNLYNENGAWKYQGNGPGVFWDFHQTGGYFSLWTAGINGKGAGSPATGSVTESERVYPTGFRQFLGDVAVKTLRTTVYRVSALPSCNKESEGQMTVVSDALNPLWNQALVSGGTNEASHVGARCNGKRWVAN